MHHRRFIDPTEERILVHQRLHDDVREAQSNSRGIEIKGSFAATQAGLHKAISKGRYERAAAVASHGNRRAGHTWLSFVGVPCPLDLADVDIEDWFRSFGTTYR